MGEYKKLFQYAFRIVQYVAYAIFSISESLEAWN